MTHNRLWLVYLAGFLMAIHFASISYLNSSLIEGIVGGNNSSLLFIFGSFFGIAALVLAPLILRKYGSIMAFSIFIILEIIAVLGMGNLSLAAIVLFFFIIHLAVDPVLYFFLDINLEQEIKREGTTGSRRGTLLLISNLAWVISPLAIVFLTNQDGFNKVYTLSGLALIPMLIIIAIFLKKAKRADASESNIITTIKSLRTNKDVARIVGIQFTLNFFYAWMIIYLPLLLSKEIGFSWSQIGLILTIMLLPFVIFQLPAGILSDKKIGEKELLITGISIMFLSTLAIPTISAPIFWIWAVILFVTRIGASVTEISSESYFFKHVKEEDTGLISLFRMARPLSYMISPLLAIPIIYYSSYSISFAFLAFFVLGGLFLVPKIDTR